MTFKGALVNYLLHCSMTVWVALVASWVAVVTYWVALVNSWVALVTSWVIEATSRVRFLDFLGCSSVFVGCPSDF